MILDSGNRTEFKTGAVRDIQLGKGLFYVAPLVEMGSMLCSTEIINIGKFVETLEYSYLESALTEFCIEWYSNAETMFLEVAKHFEEGTKKYGEYNWQKGIPIHCYIDSAMRHYLKCRRGDNDERHDRAFVWNILCAMWTIRHKPEMLDIGKASDTLLRETLEETENEYIEEESSSKL